MRRSREGGAGGHGLSGAATWPESVCVSVCEPHVWASVFVCIQKNSISFFFFSESKCFTSLFINLFPDGVSAAKCIRVVRGHIRVCVRECVRVLAETDRERTIERECVGVKRGKGQGLRGSLG